MLPLFIAILAFANLQTTFANCGERLVSAAAIVGGADVYAGKYPWQVSIRRDYTVGPGNYHTCGGTIISKNIILTANHCFDPLVGEPDAEEYEIVVGNHRVDTTDSTQQSFSIAEIITHDDFDSRTFANDITLLRLSSNITFNNYIQPACLPNQTYSAGTMTWVTGWGDQETENDSDILQEVQVPIIDSDTCNQKTWYDGEVLDDMICAGYSTGGKDSCQGDSGGPVVVETNSKFQVIGITSWGYGCADAKNPGVYTNVHYFLSWINSNM